MNETIFWLDTPTCAWIQLGLFHFLWQATLIGILVWACSKSKLCSSKQRYVFNLTGLIGMAICMLCTLFVSFENRTEPVVAVATEQSTEKKLAPAIESANVESQSIRISESPAEKLEQQAVASMVPSKIYHPDQVIAARTVEPSRLKHSNATITVFLWGVGVVLMLARLLAAIVGGWRMKRSAYPVADSGILASLERQTRRMGLTNRPAILWCHRVAVPIVVGLVKPIVLLPPSIASGLSAVELDLVLAHELAHLRRWDPIWQVIQRTLEAVFFFHPAVWYVSRQVSIEREKCCDDLVVDSGVSQIEYAAALVRTAEVCKSKWSIPVTGLTIFSRRGREFGSRVRRLLVPASQLRPASHTLIMLFCASLVAAANFMVFSASINQDDYESKLSGDLVTIFGEDRARLWGMPKSLLASQDEKQLFVTESLGYVSIFDVETLKRVKQFRAHSKRCLDIALFEADTRLLTVSIDATARLWDLTSAEPQLLDEYNFADKADSSMWLTLSTSTNGIAAIRSDKELAVFKLEQDKIKKHLAIPTKDNRVPYHFALSPNGSWLVVGTPKAGGQAAGPNGELLTRESLNVWDVREANPTVVDDLQDTLLDQLKFSKDGRALFTTHFARQETVHWAFDQGQLKQTKTLEGGPTPFSSYTFSEDGSRMGFGAGAKVTVYEHENGHWNLAHSVPTGNYSTCLFLGDGGIIATAGQELQRWDLKDGQFKKRPGPSGHRESVMALMFDAKTQSLISAGQDQIIEWSLDVADPSELNATELGFSDVGKMWKWNDKGFLIRRDHEGGGCSIEGIRRSGKKMLRRFTIDFGDDYTNAAWCAAMHPDRSILATGHWDHKIRLWNVNASTPVLLKEWEAHAGHVCAITFSPDGLQLASVGWDKTTYTWQLDSLEDNIAPERKLMGKHEDIVRSVAWSPDGKFLASGGEDGQILFWDMAKDPASESLMHPEDGPPIRDWNDARTVDTLQFSQDGTQLLSGDARGRVAIWSTDTREIVKRWQLPGIVWDAKFSPDQSRIATANYDGTIYLLDCESDD